MNCEVFQARLISGERPNEDAALSAHVGSCLRCFRTAADMRDVPRLAALLRDSRDPRDSQNSLDGETTYDPGARFWETFPSQVSAAWVSSRPIRRAGWWERASIWLRRPVPAALTGAACAVGLAFLVMRPAGGPEGGTAVLSAEPGLAGELGAQVGSQAGSQAGSDVGSQFGSAEPGDEAVGELDVEALASLRDQLDRALTPGAELLSPLEPGTEQANEEATEDGAALSDPAKVAEDLEMLDETGLLALRDNLGTRI
jgi:hypothetical protein